MVVSGSTDIGHRYDENQDSYRAGILSGELAWLVLCDGMGGLSSGRLASQLAVNAVSQWMSEHLIDCVTKEDVTATMTAAIHHANDIVFDETIHLGQNQAMGTTVVVAVIFEGEVFTAHCGDSRAYLYQRGELIQLTKDHSFVQNLVDVGSITEEQAYQHPRRNLITRALGVEPRVSPELNHCSIRKGDTLFLCSDGLSNVVSAAKMKQILKYHDFYECPGLLVGEAVQLGGTDNITTVMVRV